MREVCLHLLAKRRFKSHHWLGLLCSIRIDEWLKLRHAVGIAQLLHLSVSYHCRNPVRASSLDALAQRVFARIELRRLRFALRIATPRPHTDTVARYSTSSPAACLSPGSVRHDSPIPWFLMLAPGPSSSVGKKPPSSPSKQFLPDAPKHAIVQTAKRLGLICECAYAVSWTGLYAI